ncbi:hypothetical protein ACWCQ1_46045 [Streptomyces sp. NPDC002144]
MTWDDEKAGQGGRNVATLDAASGRNVYQQREALDLEVVALGVEEAITKCE